MTVTTPKLSPLNDDHTVFGKKGPLPTADRHYVSGRPIYAPYIDPSSAAESGIELDEILLGLGCFWGAELKFWNTEVVYTTAVGYAAGAAGNPTYKEVCTGATGHAEVVLVVYDRNAISLEKILQVFLESHDPTQGMRQGNDIGTQYRSGIYCHSDSQLEVARRMVDGYQIELKKNVFGPVTTEVKVVDQFFYAEDYHQQYLAKNPSGYCGIGGTGVSCVI